MQHIMNGYVVSAILYFKMAAKKVKKAFKIYMKTELPQMICLVLKPIGSHIGIVEHFIQYELEHRYDILPKMGGVYTTVNT